MKKLIAILFTLVLAGCYEAVPSDVEQANALCKDRGGWKELSSDEFNRNRRYIKVWCRDGTIFSQVYAGEK